MGLFDELSDADFEVLVADLFTREMGQRFEAFAPGADGGVDGQGVDGRHLVQCKHYRRSSFSHLKSQATKQRKKLEDIDPTPDRFDFVTSMDLTSGNKDTLVAELHPFATSHAKIWGYKDVEQLLRKHEDVERTHVKLWLRSSAQLDRLLNNAAYERTHALLVQIQGALPRYVQTDAMREASRLLAQERVCIVSGPPGVGKTTLAYLLLLQAVELRFQPFEVVADVEEAWRLHKPSEPQVFFFDDFLGRTQLSDGTSSDPRSLLRFIKEIAARTTSV
ncbi:MAG: restriction endonuclease [Actinomycetota bacterium]|nr:restriction endonuclease [Actinomycetota bacterium]